MASKVGDTTADARLLTPREATALFQAHGRKAGYKTLARLHGIGYLTARRTLGGHRRYTEHSARLYLARTCGRCENGWAGGGPCPLGCWEILAAHRAAQNGGES